LSSILGLASDRYGARQLEAQELEVDVARAFLTAHHLQGAGGGAEHIGLKRDNGIVAVMSFASPNASRGRDSTPGTYELVRYCVAPGISIPVGAEKLLSYWKSRHPEAKRLISYSDNRWSAGNLYRRLGFQKLTDGVPSYW